MGVHLFLVLSGFCLTYSLIRREQSGRSPTLRRFLADRWWRIAPPYYVAIALYLVANAVQVAAGFPSLRGEPNTLRQVAMHLGFLHGLREDTIEAINSPFWSLSLEFQFYATLPLLFAMAGRFGYGRVIAAVFVASFAWRAAVLYVVPGHAFLLNGFFLGRWTEFALGMGVAAWYAGPGRSDVANRAGLVLRLAACGAILLGASSLAAGRGAVLAADPAIGAGFALILGATLVSAERGGRLGRMVASPMLVRVGAGCSFSLYLTHSLALAWIDRGYAALRDEDERRETEAALFATAGVAVGLSGGLFFRTVERRFLRSVDLNAGPATVQQAGPHPAEGRPRPLSGALLTRA